MPNQLKLPDLMRSFRRWRSSRLQLHHEIDTLSKENERLQKRVLALQAAKDQAEKQAEDRRREKEALRAKMNTQKKASEGNETLVAQLGAKITELRAEIEKLKRSKKK